MIEKQVALVVKLYDRTLKGKVEWENSSRVPNAFQCSFSDYTVRINLQERNDTTDVFIRIFNQNGAAIETFSDESIKGKMENPYALMSDLYERAKRIALGSDKALDDLLSALEGEPGEE
jgi:hypothetical protein